MLARVELDGRVTLLRSGDCERPVELRDRAAGVDEHLDPQRADLGKSTDNVQVGLGMDLGSP
jgi:hypothetical protein